MYRIQLLLIFLYSAISLEAEYYISGHVYDADSKETMIGACLYLQDHTTGGVTNDYGYYSLSSKSQNTQLRCSFIGYTPFKHDYTITSDTIINIYLKRGLYLDEVSIKGTKSDVTSAETGTSQLSAKQMQMLPSLTGEVDVIKVLQFMPGISSASEASASILVRGGNADENLILLDDVPLYYSGHLGGFTSIFDESAIKSIKAYKAGFPARFGERLSSVVDIRTRDGNMTQRKLELQIGTLVSKISVNGPIIKDKMSYAVSLRRSNIGWFMRPVSYYECDKEGFITYNFYDANAKLNYIFSNKDRAYISFYRGQDKCLMKGTYTDSETVDFRYKYNAEYGLLWHNTVGSFRWNHIIRPNVFSNLTIAAIKYEYEKYNTLSQHSIEYHKRAANTESNYNSKVIDYLAKIDFHHELASGGSLKYGTKLTQHFYAPSNIHSECIVDSTALSEEEYQYYGYPSSSEYTGGIATIKALEMSVYTEYLFSLWRLDFNVGLRNTYFIQTTKTYASLQPRANINYRLHYNGAIKTSFARMEQFTHMLNSDNGGGLPSDVWVPVGDVIKPGRSDQYSLGYYYDNPTSKIKGHVDVFHKKLDHLLNFSAGESIFSLDDNWQEHLAYDGEGRINGCEFFIQKSAKKLNAWIAYTWTKNQRQFSTLNQGEPFPFKYERRHDFEVAANYKINDHIDISASWNYASGIYQTLSQQRALGINNVTTENQAAYSGQLNESGYKLSDIYIYSKKNNFQYPAYQRLDLSISFRKQKKHGLRTLTLGVINAYNYANPYTVYYKYNTNDKLELEQKTLFPILPSISWKYSFGASE